MSKDFDDLVRRVNCQMRIMLEERIQRDLLKK